MSNDTIVRNRTVYGTTCRDIINSLYGLGFDPKRVEMVRLDGPAGNRVRFDVVIDGEFNFFESKTIEELSNALEGIEMAKKMFGDNNLDISKLFDKPSEGRVHDQIAISFGDKALAEAVMPVPPGNSNVRDTAQVAASSIIPYAGKEKNPARVAAGRRSAAKRWNHAAGIEVPQVTASPMGKGRSGTVVPPAEPSRKSARTKL